MRLLFMGSDAIALPLLDWLAGDGGSVAALVAVVTGPDRPEGRGLEVKPNPVALWAAQRAVPALKPEKLDAAALSAVRALRPDVALVVAYGHILRDEFIGAPRLGTLNLHASLLPRYRGASPIQAAVAAGERETGMSLMRIVRELDAGPVADVERVGISPLDTAIDVERKLAAASIGLVARALPRLADESLAFAAQDASLATFCRRLAKADGVLDFSAPAATLAARVNGLNPWPSVVIDLAGAPVKLGLADAVPGGTAAPPGQVCGGDSEGIWVGTGSGTLRLRRLQRPGGRMLGAAEFVRGFPVPVGTVVPSKTMPALVATAPFGR
jgi:methionyl-tRNA formyltransferase